MKKRAIFLDRDGVINKEPVEHDYVKNWGEMKILPEAKKALALIKQSGYLVVVITNQRGVARGLMREEDVHGMHKKLNEKLGGNIDAFYCCFHNVDENCECRKPKPGLVRMAAEELKIDVERSWVVGNSVADMECGLAAGTKVRLVETNGNIFQAVKQIVGDGKKGQRGVKSTRYGTKSVKERSPGK